MKRFLGLYLALALVALSAFGQTSTRPNVGAPAILAKGVVVTTTATAVLTALPLTAQSTPPNRVRLSATAAAYVRLGSGGTATPATAAASAAGSGYKTGDTVTLAGGTAYRPAVVAVASTKLATVAIANGGTGYTATNTITVAGGAVITVDSVNGGGTILTAHVSTPGAYTAEPATLAQSTTNGSGTAATLSTLTFAVLTATVRDGGSYSSLPANPVAQLVSSGAGTGATFNVTWLTAASSGDLMIQPGEPVILDAVNVNALSALQVTTSGTLQISPLEN